MMVQVHSMWYGMPLPMVMSKNVSSFTHVYAVTKKEKAVLIQVQKQHSYYDYIINDLTKVLMPAINKEYSTLTGRENTAVCGFSMGGRETLNIGIRRPDLFMRYRII